ncbi:hypothetical protein KO516_10135 [Citreicella sp. C3M06]|uniref:hypothetical protein n=1 Tax=Citreicella sp. C3M06 TaxID=2841564 RepID=UPI001C0871BD|nr:hypothetical protein [Citreicella sp. C3M06]MBU2961165.1 hypothetical protein [Citreicella sp. C3M06]
MGGEFWHGMGALALRGRRILFAVVAPLRNPDANRIAMSVTLEGQGRFSDGGRSAEQCLTCKEEFRKS